MTFANLERAAHLHMLATQFRDFAAETEWDSYRARMLEMAQELDLEGARLDHYRLFARDSLVSRAG